MDSWTPIMLDTLYHCLVHLLSFCVCVCGNNCIKHHVLLCTSHCSILLPQNFLVYKIYLLGMGDKASCSCYKILKMGAQCLLCAVGLRGYIRICAQSCTRVRPLRTSMLFLGGRYISSFVISYYRFAAEQADQSKFCCYNLVHEGVDLLYISTLFFYQYY